MADLIDRKAALDICDEYNGHGYVWLCIRGKIEQLPSEERKTGMWKSDRLVSTNGGTYGVRRCSVCEAYYQDIGYGWNYCPNCGAIMEGEDNG